MREKVASDEMILDKQSMIVHGKGLKRPKRKSMKVKVFFRLTQDLIHGDSNTVYHHIPRKI